MIKRLSTEKTIDLLKKNVVHLKENNKKYNYGFSVIDNETEEKIAYITEKQFDEIAKVMGNYEIKNWGVVIW